MTMLQHYHNLTRSTRSALLSSILLFHLLFTLTTTSKSPLSGPLSDCCCSAETISKSNTDFQALLEPLVTNSTYFSVFHVALSKECPFWPDDGTCAMKDCSVCECPDDQVPRLWRKDNQRDVLKSGALKDEARCIDGGENTLRDVKGVLRDGVKWVERGEEVMWTAEEKERDMVFVDLRENVERYTGYDGEGARRIWRSIYEENCFRFARHCRAGFCTEGACKEERVLYRLISGIHTSINMHIAKEYPLQNTWGFGETWRANVPLYVERVKLHPKRIENLYFTFAVILRAVAKASRSLLPKVYDYSTGDIDNDVYTRANVERLLQHPLLEPECTTRTFDESDMFLSSKPSTATMLSQFKGAFRNISAIMDCVGCEKCRVWGKLQFLGVGTALRILFEKDPGPLKRNEVIALINLMFKLSTSVEWVAKMEQLLLEQKREKFVMLLSTIILVSLGLTFLFIFVRERRKSKARKMLKDRKRPRLVEPLTDGKQMSNGIISENGRNSDELRKNGLRRRKE